MAEGGSKVVVYAALAGNAAIAATKYAASAMTGSSAMLSEAVHSTVDTLDQVLLLVGEARGRRAPSTSHPFGYGLEVYFWSFTVALMVFLAGGAFAVWEGVQRLHETGPAERPLTNYIVLGVSFLFEGASFAVGYREFRKVVGGRRVSLVRFIRRSKDPNLFVTLLEDGAALAGLVIAALGVTGHVLGLAWADGAASIAIGVLLMSVAFVLGNETRSLIAGEAADPAVVQRVRDALASAGVGEVDEVATLQLGPNAILVAITLACHDGADLPAWAQAVRGADERITRVYFRPRAAVAQGGAAKA